MTPVDEQLVAGAVRAVLDASGLTDARLRITVTSGPGPAGLRRGPRPSVLVTAAPLGTPAPARAAGRTGRRRHRPVGPQRARRRSPG